MRHKIIQPEFKAGKAQRNFMNESMFLDNKPSPLVSNFKFRPNRNRSKEIGKMFTTWCPKTMSFDYHKDNADQNTGPALGFPSLQDPREDLRNNTIYMQ